MTKYDKYDFDPDASRFEKFSKKPPKQKREKVNKPPRRIRSVDGDQHSPQDRN